jgi:hypothetical protein
VNILIPQVSQRVPSLSRYNAEAFVFQPLHDNRRLLGGAFLLCAPCEVKPKQMRGVDETPEVVLHLNAGSCFYGSLNAL